MIDLVVPVGWCRQGFFLFYKVECFFKFVRNIEQIRKFYQFVT